MSNESIHPSLYPDLYEASISELKQGLNSGQFSSVDLTKAYLARIDEVNSELRAILETNPRVLSQAAALDAERSKRGSRGPLHGIPVLIKDNLATDPADGMQTTAGSYALLNSISPRAAHVVSSLSAAGALILGKTSLSEWSNFRGKVPSGWCARGGQGKSPYVRDADPSGSSSGSAIAAAVGLAAACVGSETDGSIVSPSRRCNIVGLKPTVGLTSRDGCIPISFTQDSIGPMGRCVTDVVFLLNAMAGPDQRDSYSLNQPTPMPDYAAFLKSDALRGARIGVPRALMPPADQLECDIEMFENALKTLRSLGATIVDNVRMPSDGVLGHEGRWLLLPSESRVLETEFRHGIEKYIAELIEVPTKIRTVDDIITFNNQHADKELIQPHYADQRRFISSAKLSMDDEYHRSVKEGYRLGRTDGIDHAIAEYNLDALVLPSDANCSTIAAIAGYPIITVPLGFKSDGALTTHVGPLVDVAPGLPLGLAFFGCAWSEAKLLGYAYAFEQETKVRGLRQPYEEAMPQTNLKDVVDAEK